MNKNKSICRSIAIICSLFAIICSLHMLMPGKVRAQRIKAETMKAVPRGPQALGPVLESFLDKYGLPALGVAVIKGGRVIAIGAVGTRKAGEKIPVTTGDRFHIGSDTKAMTSLLAAMLVEEKRLRWDSTVEEIFPELKKSIAPGWGSVTLEQLLSHTSGLPADNERFVNLMGESLFRGNDDLKDMRYYMLSKWITEPVAAAPRRQFAYSNMGYIMAGAMIERITGRSWEELVTERVFVPLRLRSAGFGPQSTMGRIDAPLPHKVINGKMKPMLAGPNADNPLMLGPAGTVHMSLEDFARWAVWNLARGKRGPSLIRPETFAKLTTPVIDVPMKKDSAPGTPSRGRYGLGWGEVVYEWAKGPFIYHGGSNNMNLAHILLQPDSDFGMVLMTNISGKKADEAFFALEEELYRRFGAE